MAYIPRNPKKERPKQARRRVLDSRYNDRLWRKLRLIVLAESPLCARCEIMGVVKAATVVDHIVRAKDGGDFYERQNLQSLCTSCHAVKSGREAHLPRGGI